MNPGRRRLDAAWSALAAAVASPPALAGADAPLAEAWKSVACGCCKDWITHLEAAGFRVKADDVGNTAARARKKVPAKLGSCRTAWVGRDGSTRVLLSCR